MAFARGSDVTSHKMVAGRPIGSHDE